MNNLHDFIKNNRLEFEKGSLLEKNLPSCPFVLFENWLNQAIGQKQEAAYAFQLATCVDNKPSARTVYLRGIKPSGYIFYTNYTSKKGIEISKNPQVAMTFFWPELEQQVRVEGMAKKIKASDSDEYFKNRPRESQLGAWASAQSEKLIDYQHLIDKIKEFSLRFKDKEIPRPNHWGGYLISPTYFEFWQGRKSRLHDRITYEQKETNWKIKRLNP